MFDNIDYIEIFDKPMSSVGTYSMGCLFEEGA